MKYTVKIDYSNKATFTNWDDFIIFVGYALDGGLKNLEVNQIDEEVSEDE